MERNDINISIALLDSLKNAEYHTITATTLSVGKYFHSTKSEMNEIYYSRKSNVKDYTFSNKKIYTQVQLAVTKLRKVKFLKDFPGTKNEGIFADNIAEKLSTTDLSPN